jgi:hypothetical protein
METQLSFYCSGLFDLHHSDVLRHLQHNMVIPLTMWIEEEQCAVIQSLWAKSVRSAEIHGRL